MSAADAAGWLRPLIAGGLARRDDEALELMDRPDCDPVALQRTYADFRTINALVSGWAVTYRRFIRPRLSTTVLSRVLDVGSGGGDLTRLLALWAARDGLRVRVTGIDPDERADAFARTRSLAPGVSYRRARTADLVAEGARFDIVVSNHMVHHLGAAALGELLADSAALAPVAVHGDITRGRLAYAGFGILTAPFFPGSFIRTDGLTSIRRSHTPAEVAAWLPDGWRVRPQGPFRYLITHGVADA